MKTVIPSSLFVATSLLLTERFVAARGEATLIAHRTLFWYSDFAVTGSPVDRSTAAGTSTVEQNEKSSRLLKRVGSVGRNTVLSFRFAVRPEGNLHEQAKLPFQVSNFPSHSLKASQLTIELSSWDRTRTIINYRFSLDNCIGLHNSHITSLLSFYPLFSKGNIM